MGKKQESDLERIHLAPQHKLVAAVDEDAIRKSDEAQKTLLLDLEKEGKKAEPSKGAKAKDAKKKDRRKSKDIKVSLIGWES